MANILSTLQASSVLNRIARSRTTKLASNRKLKNQVSNDNIFIIITAKVKDWARDKDLSLEAYKNSLKSNIIRGIQLATQSVS